MVTLQPRERLILATVCKNRANTQTTERIAAQLKIPNSDVDMGLRELAHDHILYMQAAPRQHGKRFAKLTDKGEVYAVVQCSNYVNFDAIVDNHPYIELSKQVRNLERAIKTEAARQFVMEFCGKRLIEKGLFNSDGENLISKSQNKNEQKSFLTEWTQFVKTEVKAKFPDDVDLGKWDKYIEGILKAGQAQTKMRMF